MENPFKKIFGGGQEQTPEESSREKMEQELGKLKEWKARVKMGMQMETDRGDASKLEEVDAKIKEMEEKIAGMPAETPETGQ